MTQRESRPADDDPTRSRWSFSPRKDGARGMTGEESEKEGFAFPRTKTFITTVGVHDSAFVLLARHGSFCHTKLYLPILFLFLSSSTFSLPPHLFHLRAIRLFVALSHSRVLLSSLSLFLSISLALFFFISLLRDVLAFLVSWSILLPLFFSLSFSLPLFPIPLFCLFILLAG